VDKVAGDDTGLDFEYKYESTAGLGATVYIIGDLPFPHHLTRLRLLDPTDTGIDISHSDFEGRASWGKTFGGYNDKDGNGHGTHCAGTAVSRHYGVAKAAKVISVKVLSDSGSGSTSDV